ncbi:helix-turn-helix domain-containing protein [Salinivibrio sp. VYel1]|uniref:helix-turn-helix domain-containing protein n=1 Tax=Salinivibrio sp. VYel1 TaxID=2490490 RepID=UPI00128E0E7B|nr:helix-turn-helix domain-containing protein [Salinivibrio sp. VYel1]
MRIRDRPKEACEVLGITQKTLIDWTHSHRHRSFLAPIRYSARRVRYLESQVYEFKRRCLSVS